MPSLSLLLIVLAFYISKVRNMDDKARHAERLMLLGNKIAYYRRKSKLSQEQLAEKIGISRVHLSHIEAPNVIQAFSINVLFDIADALGIEPMELFNFDK